MKRILLLAALLLPCLQGEAQNTQQRGSVTTSQFSREALTNETAEGWRAKLDVGMGTNSGGSGNGHWLTATGAVSVNPVYLNLSGSPRLNYNAGPEQFEFQSPIYVVGERFSMDGFYFRNDTINSNKFDAATRALLGGVGGTNSGTGVDSGTTNQWRKDATNTFIALEAASLAQSNNYRGSFSGVINGVITHNGKVGNLTNQIWYINVMDYLTNRDLILAPNNTVNTAIIQSVLDLVTNFTVNGPGGITEGSFGYIPAIYFPPGNYYVNGPLYIKGYGTRIFGAGPTASVIYGGGGVGGYTIFNVRTVNKWDAGGSAWFVEMTDLGITRSRIFGDTNCAINLQNENTNIDSGAHRARLVRLNIHNFFTGIKGAGVTGVEMDSVQTMGNHIGYDLTGCQTVTMNNCFGGGGSYPTSYPTGNPPPNDTILIQTNLYANSCPSAAIKVDYLPGPSVAQPTLPTIRNAFGITIMGGEYGESDYGITANTGWVNLLGPNFEHCNTNAVRIGQQARVLVSMCRFGNTTPANTPSPIRLEGHASRYSVILGPLFNSGEVVPIAIADDNVTNLCTIPHYLGITTQVTNVTDHTSFFVPFLTNRVVVAAGAGATVTTGQAGPITTYTVGMSGAAGLNYLNVTNYGAVGDNVTDNEAAIEAALAAANATRLPVYFPPGFYRVRGTVDIPASGQSGLTNQITMFGNSYTSTRILGTNANTPVFKLASTATVNGALRMTGLTVSGAAQDWGLTNYTTIAGLPLGAPVISLGDHSGLPYGGGGLAAFNIKFDNCKINGGRVGIAATNVQGLTITDCWVEQNAIHNVVMAHVDSALITSGHWGTLLCTNRAQMAYNFLLCGSAANSQWDSPTNYFGGADPGVHKMFVNLECNDPFIWADHARFTVIGGQFENLGAFNSPLTNGWCYLTNSGQYNFIGCTIALPGVNHLTEGSTNSILFNCSGNASAGLRVEGCSIGPMDPVLSAGTIPTFFRIVADPDHDYFYPPYYTLASTGPQVGGDNETFANCLYQTTGGVNSYLHIKQGGADSLNLASLRQNGRRVAYLNITEGNDVNGRPYTNQPYADGPFRAFMQPYFNDANDLYYAYAACYDPTVTAFKPWYFKPVQWLTNADGTAPRNFRITVPILCTNVFTNLISYDLYSLKTGGSQQANGSGSWGYYSTTTNVQNYVGTLTLASPPTSPVGIRWGVNASAWAITNRFFFFDPKIEYW